MAAVEWCAAPVFSSPLLANATAATITVNAASIERIRFIGMSSCGGSRADDPVRPPGGGARNGRGAAPLARSNVERNALNLRFAATPVTPVRSPEIHWISSQLEVLEVERTVEPAALSAEPLPAAPQRLAGHVHDGQAQVLHRGDARRRGQRVALARQVVLELVERPR